MKKSTQKNDNDTLKDLFYELLDTYRIEVKTNYQFVYDDFFYHLINDTNDEFIKKSKNNKIFNLIDYKKSLFKNMFYMHYSNSQWFYRILKPEEDKEVIRESRNKKLKEIENGSM